MTETCMHCRFWDRGYYSALGVDEDSKGNCRRPAPTADQYGRGQWPETMAVDWCGEWEPKDGEEITPGLAIRGPVIKQTGDLEVDEHGIPTGRVNNLKTEEVWPSNAHATQRFGMPCPSVEIHDISKCPFCGRPDA
jgi:hypothetical protein